MQLRRFAPPLLAALVLALAVPARADVSLPHVFGSHMVLQRERDIPVWGWAAPGEKVSVQLGAQPAVSATADAKGDWRVTLPPTPAGGPFALKVAGKNTLTLDDVLVGEVWLCSGQSNMQFTVGGAINAQQEIAAANFPQIRALTVPRVPAAVPAPDVKADWRVCSPETVAGFTACGYFMARKLHQDLKVPVGIIDSSWGGTRIEPWTPPVGFEGLPRLATIHRQTLLADPRTPEYKDALGKYLDTLDGWLKTAREALAKGDSLAAAPAYPQELLPLTNSTQPHQQPTTLYNGMVSPLVAFAIRGAIWYQGESNHNEGSLYTEKMKALIGGWRKVWGEGDFPFYYVQIAPYAYGNEDPYILPEFWEAQAAALAIPNTGMVVTSDIGNVQDIHPKNKQEVGRRLALLALANDYGKQGLVCTGPVFRSLEQEPGKLRVRFDNTAGGLASRDGKPLTHFEVIGEETDFVPAQAAIEGDSVVLSAAGVKQPVAMRFAWHRNAEPNLMNKEGLPATAFRAGKVPERDYLALKVAEAKDYQLVYSLDLSKLGVDIAYDEDHRKEIAGPFDRVAYFLEVQKPGEDVQYVYVSMDAFTNDLTKIGVPTFASKAVFQRKVSKLNVVSNVKGIVTGTGLAGGSIEFWPGNYAAPNVTNVPGASNDLYDFGDQQSLPENGYGSMQVHNIDAKQTIFAVNNWRVGASADIGIGNSEGKTRDWTFTGNAASYRAKRLRVLVHPSAK